MMEPTIDVDTTFRPWYAGLPLVSPHDGQSSAHQLRERVKRADRIRYNVAATPVRSMFAWADESGRAA